MTNDNATVIFISAGKDSRKILQQRRNKSGVKRSQSQQNTEKQDLSQINAKDDDSTDSMQLTPK